MRRSRMQIKVQLTPSQMGSVRRWLKRMRCEDQLFAKVPKARFGSSYVRLEIETAIALMPWTDTRTSGDFDAYRFKHGVLSEIKAKIERAQAKYNWLPFPESGLPDAYELIKATPVGEYMSGVPKALELLAIS